MRPGPLRYLLDTNIVSELVRDPHGPVAARALKVGEARLATSVIVACELRYGAVRSGSPRLLVQLGRVLAVLPVLALEPGVDEAYADLRTALEKKGKPIGHHDLFIAAHALTLSLTVVTRNRKEFGRVPRLKVEAW